MFGAVVSPAVVQYEAYILEKRLLFFYVVDSRGMERVSPIILASVLGIAARVEVTVSTAMMSLDLRPKRAAVVHQALRLPLNNVKRILLSIQHLYVCDMNLHYILKDVSTVAPTMHPLRRSSRPSPHPCSCGAMKKAAMCSTRKMKAAILGVSL